MVNDKKNSVSWVQQEIDNFYLGSINELTQIRAEDNSFRNSIERWYLSATNALLAGNGAACIFLLTIISNSNADSLTNNIGSITIRFLAGLLVITANYPLVLFYKYRKENLRLIEKIQDFHTKAELSWMKLKAMGYNADSHATGQIAWHQSLVESSKPKLAKARSNLSNMDAAIFFIFLVSGVCFGDGVLKGLLYMVKTYGF